MGDSLSMMASVRSSTEAVQDIQDVQDSSTFASTPATMTNILQDLPVGAVAGVVSSTMDVSDDASSTTGVSITVTGTQATQENCTLNANITAVSDMIENVIWHALI